VGVAVLLLFWSARLDRGDGVVAPPWQPRPVPAGFYGINGQAAFAGEEADWPRVAAQIARAGVGTVRRDALWSSVEPDPPVAGRHVYHWKETDALVAALARSGLRWYPIADYATDWAGVDGWQSPPRRSAISDYANYAGALARRYGRDGRFWRDHPNLPQVPVQNYEIWNEPNFSHFWPQQSYAPARLGAMYLESQRQIHRADADASVVLGGLAAAGSATFLSQLLSAHPTLLERLQAVGLHPYGGGADGGLELTYARIESLRSALDRLWPDRSVPIEVTEIGWAVPPTPEDWRSWRLRRLVVELPRSDCDISRLVVFSWLGDPATTEAGFGIATPDGTLTPAGRSFGQAVRAMVAGGRSRLTGQELECAFGSNRIR
jgi:hypothetical protein